MAAVAAVVIVVAVATAVVAAAQVAAVPVAVGDKMMMIKMIKNRYIHWLLLVAFSLLLARQPVMAEENHITFPTLSARVVDNAELFSPATRSQLIRTLNDHEIKTTNQIVVVTLQSLNGKALNEYTHSLFNHWGLGRKDKNNGVLLLIAVKERKMRIEVGYGLEKSLTDAIAHQIIQTTLRPAFRENHFDDGVKKAINQIISAIEGAYHPKAKSIIASLTGGAFLLLFVGGGISFLIALIVNAGKEKAAQKNTKKLYRSLKAIAFSYCLIPIVVAFEASDLATLPLLTQLFVVLLYFLFLVLLKRVVKMLFKRISQWKLWQKPVFVRMSARINASNYRGGGGGSGGGGASGGW